MTLSTDVQEGLPLEIDELDLLLESLRTATALLDDTARTLASTSQFFEPTLQKSARLRRLRTKIERFRLTR